MASHFLLFSHAMVLVVLRLLPGGNGLPLGKGCAGGLPPGAGGALGAPPTGAGGLLPGGNGGPGGPGLLLPGGAGGAFDSEK